MTSFIHTTLHISPATTILNENPDIACNLSKVLAKNHWHWQELDDKMSYYYTIKLYFLLGNNKAVKKS